MLRMVIRLYLTNQCERNGEWLFRALSAEYFANRLPGKGVRLAKRVDGGFLPEVSAADFHAVRRGKAT